LGILFALPAAGQVGGEPPSPQELFKKLAPSVFVVEALDAQGRVMALGSAVVLDRDFVVTSKHVVDGALSFRVRQGKKSWPAAVTHASSEHDLARLSVEGLKAQSIRIRNSSMLEVGERVYAIGAPQGLELTFSEGIISSLRDFEGGRVIQTTAAMSSGSSGGGLFDARGWLVGITTAVLVEGQNLNFAVPGEWVAELEGSPPSTPSVGRGARYQSLVWFLHGNAQYDLGRYEGAIQAYHESIRLIPDPVTWYNLGLAYDHNGQYEEALQAYEEAIRMKPSYSSAWNNLGFAYAKQRQYDRAIRAYQEVIRLNPDDALGWANLGDAYADLGQDDKCVQAYSEVIRLKPDSAKAWDSLGYAYARQGNRAKVLEVYERLKVLDRDLADRFFRLLVLP
jgi:predicted TPR repeat methyltransferase